MWSMWLFLIPASILAATAVLSAVARFLATFHKRQPMRELDRWYAGETATLPIPVAKP